MEENRIDSNDLNPKSSSNLSKFVSKKKLIFSLLFAVILTPLIIYTNCGELSQVSHDEQGSHTGDLEALKGDVEQVQVEGEKIAEEVKIPDEVQKEEQAREEKIPSEGKEGSGSPKINAQTCLNGGVPTPCQVVVDSGQYFSCAIVSKRVQCWGDNRAGQLGQGTVGGYQTTPVTVPGIVNATAIAAGNQHACAVDNGRVKCWGSNIKGQVGNGNINSPGIGSPQTVAGLSNMVDVAAGIHHSCALSNSNKVWCWGSNEFGQFGNGTLMGSLTPVNITQLNGTTMIAAGFHNTCVIAGTQAKCMGHNRYGQVGNGVVNDYISTPYAIASLPNVTSITTDGGHSCAVTNTGSAKCWGANDYGQLGNGNTAIQSSPVQVANLTTNVASISAGNMHTCAVTTAGSARCWGQNQTGQVGSGNFNNNFITQQPVNSLSNAAQIAAGNSHTCAVTATYLPNSNVSIQCFGNGLYGALGNGSINDQNTPVFAVQNHTCCNWVTMSIVNAPSPRYAPTNIPNAVWTGSKMIVWGGSPGALLGDGGVFDPVSNSWTTISMAGAPASRYSHTEIWAGAPINRMIVWGGAPSTNTGSKYNPATDTWVSTSTMNAPSPRYDHSTVWTGTEMIVWGGQGNTVFNTGSRYNPNTDTWSSMSTIGAPSARAEHSAIWAGAPINRMIVWGGTGLGITYLADGAMYNPANDTWTPITNTNAPSARDAHTAVWTGTEMIIFGGLNDSILNNGGKYNPTTNTWTPMAAFGNGGGWHKAIWAGSSLSMIVVGNGYNHSYDPITDTWTTFCSLPPYLIPQVSYLTWTGTQMIAWGGSNNGLINTGLIYTP